MTASTPVLGVRTRFLEPFVGAGVLGVADVFVADTIARLVSDVDDRVLLAAALSVRATRLGHVCVVLRDLPGSLVLDDDTWRPDAERVGTGGDLYELPWPEPESWVAELERSDVVASIAGDGAVRSGVVDGTVRPLVFDGERVYLERYWRFERQVGDDLIARVESQASGEAQPPDTGTDEVLDGLFGPVRGSGETDLQRRAAHAALVRDLVVIAGGPGTGKTRTIARMLAAAYEIAQREGRNLQVALAAPTGKAAARMTEAVRSEVAAAGVSDELVTRLSETEASTVHRLLGGREPNFRHNRGNPLAADMVVVDEASMVSLPLMSRLLEAVRPQARLVLVGDPFQLASIEAGAVLGDVVGAAEPQAGGRLGDNVIVLRRVHRFAADSTIAALAAAVRDDEVDTAVHLLSASRGDVAWVRPDDSDALEALRADVVDSALAVACAALDGDAATGLQAATDVKVLAATRRGPLGTVDWQEQIERRVARREPRLRLDSRWYVGRPVIVTRNDYLNRLVNGDSGLVIAENESAAVAFTDADPFGSGVRLLAPSQLSAVETWWAMTIHKSQGSEYRHAVVSLPCAGSPILTRELLYTAITRAKQKVTIVGSEEAIRAAIARPVARASGLRSRLWPSGPVEVG